MEESFLEKQTSKEERIEWEERFNSQDFINFLKENKISLDDEKIPLLIRAWNAALKGADEYIIHEEGANYRIGESIGLRDRKEKSDSPIIEELKKEQGFYIDGIIANAIIKTHSEEEAGESGKVRRSVESGDTKNELERESHFKTCEKCQEAAKFLGD